MKDIYKIKFVNKNNSYQNDTSFFTSCSEKEIKNFAINCLKAEAQVYGKINFDNSYFKFADRFLRYNKGKHHFILYWEKINVLESIDEIEFFICDFFIDDEEGE